MPEHVALFIYIALALLLTLAITFSTGIFPSVKDSREKFMPYESGMKTTTHLLQESFQLRHYLVALIFLIFDIEVVFLYPWAVVAKSLGKFAFYEMAVFLGALIIGFIYVWRKKGLQWE